MAQENTPAASGNPQSSPFPEQAGNLLLILDKDKLLLQALAEADPGGKMKLGPPTKEHNNDFLRLSCEYSRKFSQFTSNNATQPISDTNPLG